MAYDAFIWLTGNTTSPLTTMATTNVTGNGTQLSPNRLYIAELRVPNFTMGATDGTMIVAIGAGSTAVIAGTGQTLATFPTITTLSAQSQTRLENTTAANTAAVHRRAFRVSEDRTFVRAQITLGGTSPTAANMSVLVLPVGVINT